MIFRKPLLLFFLLAITSQATFSQAQAYNWFFGYRHGLNFSTGSPVYQAGCQSYAMEGGSTVSDRNGNLLFYTDGRTVWNRNHTQMANGFDLAGGTTSSTQSCIIVPKIDEKEYYIFTADEEGLEDGLQYSIVDMASNNGLGTVTLKNQLLVAHTAEKVTAIRHCNQKDYWIVTHRYGTNEYYAYLATENGVNTTPVISRTGMTVTKDWGHMAGVLKGTPDGKKIVALHASVGVDLSDFNNQTGIVSNTHEIFGNENAAHYGAEFSANSEKLYLAITGYWSQQEVVRISAVFQYDLTAPDIAGIINSKFQVFRFPTTPTHPPLGTMQRASNGKIYMAVAYADYLSVINSPELSGPACDFVKVGVSLPARNDWSLPNLINDYRSNLVADTFKITSSGWCVNKPVSFSYTPVAGVSSVKWDFGDPVSGSQNSSTQLNPSHSFAAQGPYTVKLVKYTPCGADTIRKQIIIGDLQVDLGKDTTICETSAYRINPNVTNASNLLWQNGSTAPTFTATTAGWVWLEASNPANGCIRRDSLLISTKPLPQFTLGRDTALCQGASLALDASVTGATYLWQDNSTGASFVVRSNGKFWVNVELNGCAKRDTIDVGSIDKPLTDLGTDKYLCPGLTLELSAGIQSYADYLWQDGSVEPKFIVNQPGVYHLKVSNPCGSTSDTIQVYTGSCNIYIPNSFTPNNDGLNDYFKVAGTGLVRQFELKIYNRYGQEIYHTNNKNFAWDGRYRNQLLPIGHYVFIMRYAELNSSEQKVLKGMVLLMR